MTTIGFYREGEDAYLRPGAFPDSGMERRWLFHGVPRSQKQRGGDMLKLWDAFSEHMESGDQMLSLLEECYARGVERPSSYGDLFQQRWRFPVVRSVVRKMFPRVPGGWQQVREAGTSGSRRISSREPLRLYDIRSAYLSALKLPLPSMETFLPVRRVSGPGLYWCPSPALPSLPYPWNAPGVHPATEDELLALPLDFRAIQRGIAFIPDGVATGAMMDDIQAWSCWKSVARSFWGRWASAPGLLRQQTFTKAGDLNTENDLGNPAFNPVWAAIITSRLRLRLWEIVDKIPVLRVYTDSIVTTAEIEEGPGVGDWSLKDTYPRGGIVTLSGVRPHATAA